MDDAARVRAAHPVGNLVGDTGALGETERSARDEVGEGRTVHQLHDDRARSAEILEAVDGRDVRVVERREQPCLALEADATLGARAHAFGQHLDRDVTVQPTIGGAIDLAHPARAEERDDLVRADSGSWNQRHESCTLLHCKPSAIGQTPSRPTRWRRSRPLLRKDSSDGALCRPLSDRLQSCGLTDPAASPHDRFTMFFSVV